MYVVEILERCANLATRVARLYRQLAERFPYDPARQKLWRELAFLEETHAEVLRRELRSFQEREETGDFLPEFEERLQNATQTLNAIEARLVSGDDLDAAAEAAVALEQMHLEELYDDLVIHGEPAFRLLMERLESALANRPEIPPTVVRRQWLGKRS